MPLKKKEAVMNIYVSFSLFSLIILIYWVIAELFTILFRFTGLPDEKARFQVLSLLTGCGFTTRESESFLSTRSRRRLVRITMLFGYVFNITIVSALINVFLSLKLGQVGQYFVGILIPLAAVAIIFVFIRVPAVRSWGDEQLSRLADRVLRRDSANSVLILDYIGKDSIALVSLKSVPEEMREKALFQLDLKTRDNILVMLIEREGRKAEPARADTVFADGDKLTVFGEYKTICSVFQARESFDEQ